MKIISALSILLLAGCSDVAWKRMTNFNQPFIVQCYSGERVIYAGVSTGRVERVGNSDSWAFVDAETMKFTMVSGSCLVTETIEPPASPTATPSNQ